MEVLKPRQLALSVLVDDLDDMTDESTEVIVLMAQSGSSIDVATYGPHDEVVAVIRAALDRLTAS